MFAKEVEETHLMHLHISFHVVSGIVLPDSEIVGAGCQDGVMKWRELG